MARKKRTFKRSARPLPQKKTQHDGRAAAMTPRQKTALLLGVVSTGALILCSLCPPLLFAAVLVAGGLSVFVSHSGESLPARPGLGPRTGPNGTGALRQLWGWWLPDVSGTRGRTEQSGNRCVPREAEGRWRQRRGETALNRREAVAGESFQFSPRDFLMGSYIGKPESPVADFGMPRIERNAREQLRERLSRPNHAVLTPNRRLSFAGEPVGAVSRFMITPQRHYPLQQPGVPSVGVLPPVSWEGFRKKNVLTPRNSPAALSPVTVKIARPEHNPPSLESLTPGLHNAPADPCSRESVLKVLKESRKREVDDDDRSFMTEQKSKRRRNDSGGSCHSAFEPLLPNGALSQLVPMPGSLKRGMTSVVEESTMKRSRTSSISSGSGVQTPRGTPGTKRNPIASSHSSSLGLPQWKKPSAPSSPASSSGSSRSHSPEGLSERPRHDDGPSPSATSLVRSDRTAFDQATVSSSRTHKVPVSADPTDSGRRKRRIQLVSSNRDDRISLPPPPELGYTITVKDLDEEKKAAIGKIQKVLETPAAELEKPISAPPTLSSLLAAPLPVVCGSVTPVINLDPPPSSTATSNLLLDALRKKSISPVSSTSAADSTSVLVSSSPVPGTSHLKPPEDSLQASQSSAAPSAFTPVSKPSSGASSAVAASALAVSSPTPVCSASQQVPAPPAASTAPLLASGFKPIFSVSTTSSAAVSAVESDASVQSFKPVFGGTPPAAVFGSAPSLTTASSAPVMSVSTSSVFGASMSSTTVTLSAFPSLTAPPTVTAPTGAAPIPAAPPAVKSLFGSWSTPSSSLSVVAPVVGSTFQFGAVATTTGGAAASSTSSNGVFSFGGTQANRQAASQKPFGFSQTPPGQNATTASFGSFVAAASTSATTTTTQSTFTFGSSTSAPLKPFTFGRDSASLVTTSNPAPVPFAFGAAATSAPSFSTPAKPVFGAGATGFAFSGTTVASTAPTFGASTQTQSSSSGAFMFGGATSLPAPTGPVQPASSGFSFGAGMSCPQFGTPATSNAAPQMGGFSFGGGAKDKPAFGTSTPAFGQSATAASIPFGNSATPVQSFNAPPFGSPATPSFSIGAGSKPSGARQRLQARRQHNRKK